MKKIQRHSINGQLAEEGLVGEQEVLAHVLDPAHVNAGGLSIVLSTARAYAGYLSTSKPDQAELCRALHIGAQASAAIFALASGKGQVRLPLADRQVTFSATGPTDATHVGNWRAGWWLAHLLRDDSALGLLAVTSVDLVRRSSTRGDECQYLFFEALQLFEDRSPGWADKLQAAVNATDPELVPLSDDDFILNILVPEMQMLFHFSLGEVQLFNEALAYALERHKKYWSHSGRRKDPNGYLALGPLAISSLAYDAGMPIAVESEYLPADLFRNCCQELLRSRT